MNSIELQAFLAGQPQAVRAFVQEYGPILRAVIRRKLVGSHRQREEDLLHDIFLGLLRDNSRVLRMWDEQKGRSFKVFLQVFAERRTLDWLRRQKREGREEPTEAAALVLKSERSQTAEVVELPEWLEGVMDRFQRECSKEDAQLFELLFIEDRSAPEVAKTLGIAVDAVYQRRHRLKARLLNWKQELSDLKASPTYKPVGRGNDPKEGA